MTARHFEVRPVIPSVLDAACAESLGSWLHRFKSQNGFWDLSSAMKHLGVGHVFTEPSFHGVRLTKLLEQVANIGGVRLDEASRMSLEQELSILTSARGSKRGPWLLKSRDGNDQLSMRYMVCPACIRESHVGVWHKQWRLTVVTHCWKHQQMLLDQCQTCGEHFNIDGGRLASLRRCSKCLTEIDAVSPTAMTGQDPSFVRYLGSSRAESWPATVDTEPRWWQGVRTIISFIRDSDQVTRWRTGGATVPVRFEPLFDDIARSPTEQFNAWSVTRRWQALTFVEWITDLWPERFICFIGQTKTRWRHVECLQLGAPPWIRDALNKGFPCLPKGQKGQAMWQATVFDLSERWAALRLVETAIAADESICSAQPDGKFIGVGEVIIALNWKLGRIKSGGKLKQILLHRATLAMDAGTIPRPPEWRQPVSNSSNVVPLKVRDVLRWKDQSIRSGQGSLFDSIVTA